MLFKNFLKSENLLHNPPVFPVSKNNLSFYCVLFLIIELHGDLLKVSCFPLISIVCYDFLISLMPVSKEKHYQSRQEGKDDTCQLSSRSKKSFYPLKTIVFPEIWQDSSFKLWKNNQKINTRQHFSELKWYFSVNQFSVLGHVKSPT